MLRVNSFFCFGDYSRILADRLSLTLSFARKNEGSKNSLLYASWYNQRFLPCSSPFMKDFKSLYTMRSMSTILLQTQQRPLYLSPARQVLSRRFPSLNNLRMNSNSLISPSNSKRREIQHNSTSLHIIGHVDPLNKTARRKIPHRWPGTWNWSKAPNCASWRVLKTDIFAGYF